MINQISIPDYDNLIRRTKSIDPLNYMDLVHDFILDGGTLRGHKFNYKSVQPSDFLLKIIGTCNTCNKCNEIKPAGCFKVYDINGKKYLGNVCGDCRNKYSADWFKEKYHNDTEYRKRVIEYVKAYNKTDHGKKVINKAGRKYYQSNKEKCNALYKDYRERNRERVNELSRIREAKYAEERKKDPEKQAIYRQKKIEASKRYREKKKLEKLNLLQHQ